MNKLLLFPLVLLISAISVADATPAKKCVFDPNWNSNQNTGDYIIVNSLSSLRRLIVNKVCLFDPLQCSSEETFDQTKVSRGLSETVGYNHYRTIEARDAVGSIQLYNFTDFVISETEHDLKAFTDSLVSEGVCKQGSKYVFHKNERGL